MGIYDPEPLGGLPVERFIEAVAAEGAVVKRTGNPPMHLHPVFNEADVYGDGKPTRGACSHGLYEGVRLSMIGPPHCSGRHALSCGVVRQCSQPNWGGVLTWSSYLVSRWSTYLSANSFHVTARFVFRPRSSVSVIV